MKSTILTINKTFLFSLSFIALLFSSCEKYELPEAGSIEDVTPPSANFAYTQGEEEAFLTYSFANLSDSAIEYAWDFGDGNMTTGQDVSNTFPGLGTYTVSLTASDALGKSDTYTETIEVAEPPEPEAIVPVIMEAGFEDESLPDGTGDGRDSWRCDFGTIMQITSSPVNTGGQAAKFPADPTDARVAYQELEVSPNQDYLLTYYYTMKTDNPGSITMRVLDGPITELPTNDDNVLGASVGTDQTDANAYVKVSIPFNTGATTTIALLITNEGEECRLDDVAIEAL